MFILGCDAGKPQERRGNEMGKDRRPIEGLSSSGMMTVDNQESMLLRVSWGEKVGVFMHQ